jgi:hypothetical protein
MKIDNFEDLISALNSQLENSKEVVRASLLKNFEAQKGFKETIRDGKKIDLNLSLNIKETEDGSQFTAEISGEPDSISKFKEDEFGSGAKNISPKGNMLKYKNSVATDIQHTGAQVKRS